MTDTCTLTRDRDETLVAYLYDDIDAAARTAFEAHLTACAVCRDELESLQSVRQRVALWAPPEAGAAVNSRHSTVEGQESTLEGQALTVHTADSRVVALDSRRSKGDARPSTDARTSTVDSPAKTSWLPDVPAWAQAAAAILILGVAAGIANLEVRYNQDGLMVRTGWSKAQAATPNAGAAARSDAVSRTELVALEDRLKHEVRALQTSAHAGSAGDAQPVRAGMDADQVRRLRVLLDESEKRQQRELALRVGEVLRDVNAQRQSDLMRIDRTLGLVENNLGVEVMKQRERVNYLMRVNQRQE